jgi:hypothetical protein
MLAVDLDARAHTRSGRRRRMGTEIPEDVRRFVRTYIRSMLQLETLLLLARDGGRWWSAHEVNLEVRSSEDASLAELERLAELALLETDDAERGRRFRFAPRDPSHRVRVDALHELRAQRYHGLIDLIYSSSRAQDFADAFKIKKDDADG